MGFEDSVIVRLGMNREPFERSLKAARGALSTFKGAMGALGASFGLGQLKGFVSGVFNLAGELKKTSQALDVSTDFLQTWRDAVGNSGGDSKNAAAHLERFTQRLKDNGKTGSDVERELRKVADAMAAQPDPVKRAKIAFDAFGRGAAELIPLLSGGSKALDEFRGKAKLTAAEIDALDTAQDDLEQAHRNAQVGTGKLTGFFLKLASAAGAASISFGKAKTFGEVWAMIGEQFAKDEIAEAMERGAKAARKAEIAASAAAEKEIADQKAIGAAYEEAHDAQVKADFDALDDAGKLNVLLEFRLKLLRELSRDNKASIANAKRFAAVARLGPDIADLQNKVGTQPGTANAPAVATARSRALALQPGIQAALDAQARMASMSARDRVLSLNPALQSVFADKHGMGKTAVEETSKGVWKLVELAEGEGLNINPKNGD